MANQPYDRTPHYPRERVLTQDWNRNASQLDRALRDTLQLLFANRFSGLYTQTLPVSGVIGAGFEVFPQVAPDLTVQVRQGLGFLYIPAGAESDVDGIAGLDDLSRYKPIYLSSNLTIPLDPVPGAGLERYDLIEVISGMRMVDPQSRDVFDTGTGAFAPQSLNKTLEFDLRNQTVGRVVGNADSTTPIGYKRGVPAAIGTAARPSITPDHHALAYIYVRDTTLTIDYDVIDDRRLLLGPYGGVPFSVQFNLTSTPGDAVTGLYGNIPHGVRWDVYSRNVAGECEAVLSIAIGNQLSSLVAPVPFPFPSSVVAQAQHGETSTSMQGLHVTIYESFTSPGGTAYLNTPFAASQRRLNIVVFPVVQAAGVTSQNFALMYDPLPITILGTLFPNGVT